MLISEQRYNQMLQCNETRRLKIVAAREAFEEITKVRRSHVRKLYSFKYAENIIDNMKGIARKALEELE